MKMRDEYTCPLELTHDAIKGKWKPIILWQLSKAPQSLSGIRHSIAGISQKMLIQHLNELIQYGFVAKTTFEGYPLQVEYDLTDRGRKIFDAITIMQTVGIEMMIEDHKEELLRTKGLL
ncbi:helix-turn-helix transcriptional regulator [Lachnoclostridium pacaense]|uniref:winged helix-turn-helix transcriptional regulator n=1 Tax=Enterocloster hominis (ex Hitch et al. 2024) TaxID=1917870 RepID=UPI001D0F9C28|nr:helix-turn-helix domain-containing protein [Lachnoclostridium pacaense]MCC2880071.1 helix-turn-helix transcriptional regulator [Lachnoclostridium pacaense]